MGKDTLNLRVDSKVKTDAEKVLEELGLSMTAAVTLYLKAIERTKSIPFALTAGKTEPSGNDPKQVQTPKVELHVTNGFRKALKPSNSEKKAIPEVSTIKGTTSFKNAIDKL